MKCFQFLKQSIKILEYEKNPKVTAWLRSPKQSSHIQWIDIKFGFKKISIYIAHWTLFLSAVNSHTDYVWKQITMFPCQTMLESISIFLYNFGFSFTHLPCSLKEELVICQLVLSDSQCSKQTSNCDRCCACK